MSPIKGLSDQMRITRLGKIRLGIKVKNAAGVEYPKAVDHFVSDNEDFHNVYGAEPKAIDICFPVDDPEAFASQYYRAYSRSRGLVCKGDGETCDRMINAATGETKLLVKDDAKQTAWTKLPCPGRECEYYKGKNCKEIMFLQFLMPKIPGLGIWQLDTSSVNSVVNINGMVAMLKSMTGGRIAMMPLKLVVVPREVSPEGKKKTVWVLQIEKPGFILEGFRPYAALPSPEDEMPEELFPTEEQQRAARQAEGQTTRQPSQPQPASPQPQAGASTATSVVDDIIAGPTPADSDDDLIAAGVVPTPEEQQVTAQVLVALRGLGYPDPQFQLDAICRQKGKLWVKVPLADKRAVLKTLEAKLTAKLDAQSKAQEG